MRGDVALRYLLSKPLLCTPGAAAVAYDVLRGEGTPPESLAARRGRLVDAETDGVERRGPVTVIPVTGPIQRYADMFTDLCGGVTTEALARDLTTALDDPTCRAVVLHIESPGGESAGICDLAAMIAEGSTRKPIVGFSAAEIASAGYYLGAACSELVIGEMAQVGCIGVVMGYIHRDDKPGVKTYEWVSSQSPDKRPDFASEKGRSVVQAVVDDLAAVFVADVAKFRGTTAEDVLENFGRGSVLVGQKAVAAGMADRLGSLEDVIRVLSDGPSPTTRSFLFPAAPSAFSHQDRNMAFSWLLKPKSDGTAEITAHTVPDAPAPAPSAAPTPAPDHAAAALAEIAARELAEARKSLAIARVETIEARADTLYTNLFSAHLIVPAEKPSLVGLFTQASLDDLLHPMADGKARTALVEGIYKTRTPHTLTREQLGDAPAPRPDNLPPGYKVLDHSTGADAVPTKARLNELVGHLVAAGMAPADAVKS